VGKSEPALLPLAESIADGNPIDWNAVVDGADADEQGIIRQLRIVANLAVLHRSLPDSSLSATARRSHPLPSIGNWAHLALTERLGSGSFGEVYRAWDRRLEREIALKLLRPGVTETTPGDPESSRIAEEGRLLARVRHPNVITVHGVEVHDGRVGLCMELIRGTTLEESLQRRGPFSAREASLIGIDLCRALAAIHGAGLIHRDVKAQNVMREDGGRIVLMDLGTGRETGGGAGSDLTGTPLYLAPEIFDGASANESTDLYSLGMLLYHLVTGTFPVRAANLNELRDAHAAGSGVRLRDARPDLPTAFVRVVDRAIALDSRRRYASAGAMEADLVEALDITTAPAQADASVPSTSTSRPPAGRLALIAFALAASIVAAFFGWRAVRSGGGVATAGPIRSIAVLPLVNLSGDPAQEYFADGMTDELIGTLGRLAGINVISRTSTMQFKGTKKPLPEIARALNADAVLEGSILVVPGNGSGPEGQRVRINARLIKAGTDTQLWDRTFERVVADVLTLQREVARAVTDGIDLRLTAEQQRVLAASASNGGAQQDFDAFNLYLKGRYYWNMRTEEGLKRSVQYFQEAIGRDAAYALGYAGLADAYNVLAVYGFAPRTEALQRSREAATKALALDDSLAEAHTALAVIHHQYLEWDAAEAEFRRALSLKPGYAIGRHFYANYLSQVGRFAEAIDHIRQAAAMDPLSIGEVGAVGSILLVARRYDEAIAQLEKTLLMDPNFARAHMVLAEAYAHKRDYARAQAEIDKVVALIAEPGPEVRADVGYIHAVAGRRTDATAVVSDLENRLRQRQEGAAGALAVVYSGLGDVDRALTYLEQARTLRDPVLVDLKTDPRFDALRGDARFDKLLASLGFAR